jgi:hypothetical protein
MAGVLLAVVVTAVIALQTIGPRRTMARIGDVMHVGSEHIGPAPWPHGSSFSVDPYWASLRKRYLPGLSRYVGLQWLSKYVGPDTQWSVLNMHAENLGELCRQRGFQWVKVEKVGERADAVLCLVVDKRVPREWLLERPRMGSLLMRQKLKLERPECFREDPQVKALIGTTWILIDRDDPEGSLARLLPGEQMHFGAVELTCGTATDANLGQRSWDLNIWGTTLSLSVYEVHGETFSGMVFVVSKSGDTMTLVPRATVKHDADGTRSDDHEDQGSFPQVRYRLAKQNEGQPNVAP